MAARRLPRYPIIHKTTIFYDVVNSSVAKLLPTIAKEHLNFGVIQVKRLPNLGALERMDQFAESDSPALQAFSDELREAEIGPVLGFNQRHIHPYLSDPTGTIPGGVFLWQGRMIYFERGLPLEQFRDKYLWSYAQNMYFTTKGFSDLLREFAAEGKEFYRMNAFLFGPAHDVLIRREKLERIALSDIIGA